jgi:hypothetical protein
MNTIVSLGVSVKNTVGEFEKLLTPQLCLLLPSQKNSIISASNPCFMQAQSEPNIHPAYQANPDPASCNAASIPCQD